MFNQKVLNFKIKLKGENVFVGFVECKTAWPPALNISVNQSESLFGSAASSLCSAAKCKLNSGLLLL